MYKEYCALKAHYPDSILLFRIGDFYEAFDADAQTVAEVCHLAFTHTVIDGAYRSSVSVSRAFMDNYVSVLCEAGHQVAVVDPAKDAGGKIVTRAIC